MGFLELFLLALGLSMDAFAVALCKGLCMKRVNWKHAAIIAAFFGGFQAGMPLAGWFLGRQFAQYIESFDHWIAFVLLVVIGGKMLLEAIKEKEEEAACVVCDAPLNYKELLLMAVATSIDALAVGVSLAFLSVQIAPSVTFIGITTFVLSFVGVAIGNRFGLKHRYKAQLAGGIVLILIAIKILADHLGWMDALKGMLG